MEVPVMVLRSKRLRTAIAVVAALSLLMTFYALNVGAAVIAAAFGSDLAPSTGVPASCVGFSVIASHITVSDLNDEQKQTAADIISVGRSLGVSDYGLVIAIAASYQESKLRSINYGDRDSLGPFQQRTSWGPAEERINPVTSARRFFTGGDAGQRGLLDIQGWEQMSVTQAAQAVQVSAYPDAYSKWEGLAREVVGAAPADLSQPSCSGATTTSTTTTAPPSPPGP